MSAPSNVSGFPAGVAPAPMGQTRPIYWSVRRELWENRSVSMAPAIIAGVFLAGYLLSTISVPHRMRQQDLEGVTTPFSLLPALLILTAFLVGVFYCLDALHSERRDRSILFWKSLPVSDLQTVLAKASIPLVVLPLLVLAIAVTVQIVMLLVTSAVLVGNGVSAAPLWSRLPLFRMTLGLIYALTAVALWHAPIYAWLLLVSSWARRAAFLWAVLPWLALAAFERMAFSSKHVMSFLGYRMTGWFESGFRFPTKDRVKLDPLTHLTPGEYLTTAALWLGLIFAAAFIAAAVRLRRNREPI